MLRRLVKKTVNRLGFDLVRKRPNQSSGALCSTSESEAMIAVVRSRTMVAHEGLEALYRQALFCEAHELAGDFVECGVWKGGAVGLMALVNLSHGRERRHLHLFDSFEEICEPDESIDGDRAIREVKMWTKDGGTRGRLVALEGIYDHRGGPGTVQENEDLLTQTIGYDPKYLHFHKGWFQETLPVLSAQIEKIAILRIDADWYASTKVCLDHLFARVVSGGFVIIDDYGAYDGCRKAVDEFLEGVGKPLFLNYVNPDIRYIIAS